MTDMLKKGAAKAEPDEIFVVFNDDYDPEAAVNAVHLVPAGPVGARYALLPNNAMLATGQAVGGYVYGRIQALMDGAPEKFEGELDYLADVVSRVEEVVFPWMAQE